MCSLLVVVPAVAAAEPDELLGSAYLRTLTPEAPPFGRQLHEAFPWDGVRVQRWRREQPEADWVVVWLDLRTPGLGYRVTPVQRTEGPGTLVRQTSAAQTTVDFLAEAGPGPRVDLAVNTVAYYPFPALSGSRVFLSEPVWLGEDNAWEPQPGALMLGLLPGRALIDRPEVVRAARPAYAFGSFLDAGVIPGGIAVRGGRAATFTIKDEPHGRTAAGVSADGRVLILVVADGYNPKVSVGLSMTDTAAVLRAAGAFEGVFLDGGGSTALVACGDDGAPVLLNRPAGMLNIPGTLRYVAVNLGFTNLRRSADPIPLVADWQAPPLVVAWAKAVTWTRIHPIQTGVYAAAGVLAALLVVRRWWKRRRRGAATRSAAAPPPS
jgi:hypothetical protein